MDWLIIFYPTKREKRTGKYTYTLCFKSIPTYTAEWKDFRDRDKFLDVLRRSGWEYVYKQGHSRHWERR